MHLARQKVQMTFFSRKMRKNKKNDILHVERNWCIWQGKKKWRSFLFVKRAILHVVKRNIFFVLFWCIWQGKKYKWRSFLQRWPSERNKKKCSFCGESHSSCSQKEQFFCPFLMHLARQKVQVTFFSREMTFRKEKKMLFLWREPFFM